MSFLIGPASGALVAGGVFYGFSHLIQTSMQQHKKELHELSRRLTDSEALIRAPPPAAARIERRPFTSLVELRWNQEVEKLFLGFYSWDKRLQDWGRHLLYGSVPPPRDVDQQQGD